MGILTNLNQGKKLKFESDDSDSWVLSENQLQQYIGGEFTGNTLEVLSISEESITIDWGEAESTLPESYLFFVD